MFSPYHFLCPRSSLQGKEKESNQPALGINLPIWNRMPGTPSLIAHLALLSKYPLFQHLMLPNKISDALSKASENDASKHVETSATNTCVDHPLLLQKQKYLISSRSKANVSNIMFFPILSFALTLACGTRRKEAISRNLKLNVRSGTDCPEPLHGCLPSIALERSSSTVDGSRISSANTSGQLI
ncbi:hypothetical protein ACFX19_045222 [Malus domestica]